MNSQTAVWEIEKKVASFESQNTCELQVVCHFIYFEKINYRRFYFVKYNKSVVKAESTS